MQIGRRFAREDSFTSPHQPPDHLVCHRRLIRGTLYRFSREEYVTGDVVIHAERYVQGGTPQARWELVHCLRPEEFANRLAYRVREVRHALARVRSLDDSVVAASAAAAHHRTAHAAVAALRGMGMYRLIRDIEREHEIAQWEVARHRAGIARDPGLTVELADVRRRIRAEVGAHASFYATLHVHPEVS